MVRPVRGTADRVGRDWTGIIGLSIVGAAVAILSFSALSDLATRFGVTGWISVPLPWGDGRFRLAWLIPLAVDVFAVMATRAWLQDRGGPEAVVYARRAAWSAIWTSIIGNGAHGALVASEEGRPLWWVLAAVLVGAVPAVALGALVHLVHLTLFSAGPLPADPPAEDEAEDEELPTDPAWERLRDSLLAEGAGRRRLARELDISEHQARTLLAEGPARAGGRAG